MSGYLGQLRSAQGRHEEAIALLEKGLDHAAKASPRLHALALAELADALLAAGREAPALDAFKQAAELLRPKRCARCPRLGPDRPRHRAGTTRARPRRRCGGGGAEAAAFWDAFDATNLHAGLAQLWHARALLATGCLDPAVAALAKAEPILAQAARPSDCALLEQTRSTLTTHA